MKENYEEIIKQNSVITAKRVILRRFSEKDANDVYEYATDELTLKYLTWGGVSTLEDVKRVIAEYYQKNGVYALELKETGKCIGCIDLRIIPEHEKASFGYVLNRSFWNKGYMTEALSVLLRLCFEKLEMNRVEATHYAGNEGSGRVMEKCGMIKEGFALQEVKIKGIFHDVVHYGISKEQWNCSNILH